MADFEESIRKLRSIAQASAEKVMMRELTVPPPQALPAISPVLSPPDCPPPTATETTPAAKKPRRAGPDVVMAVPDVAKGFAIPPPPPGPAPFTVVKVPDSLVGLLIGKSGSGLRHLEAENLVNITVGKLVEGGHRRVCIEGEPSCQAKAAQMIEHFVGMKEAQDAVKQVMTKQVQCQEILQIPERLVGLMIGKRGENITKVRERFGINTQFDKENTLGDVRILTLTGQAENVSAAKEQVEIMVLQYCRRDGIFNEHLETKYGNCVGLSTNTAPPPPPMAPPLTMQTGREMPGAGGCSFDGVATARAMIVAASLLVAWASTVSTVTALGAADARPSGFQDWLRRVRFSAPNISLDMPSRPDVDNVSFTMGSCTGLTIGSAQVQDHSAGPALFLNFNISGVSVQCSLVDDAMGLTADVALRDSWAGASVQVQPFDFSGKPLPVAVMMTDCMTKVQISHLLFSGTPEIAGILNTNTSAAENQLKASLTNLLCVQISQEVTTLGSSLLENVAGIASELLVPQPLPPLPQAVAPLMDWGTYVPIQLGKAMLAQRFGQWHDKLTVSQQPFRLDVGLRFPVTENFAIRLDALQVEGLNTIAAPGLWLNGSRGIIEAGASAGQLSLSLTSAFQVAPLQPHLPRLVESLNLTLSQRDLLLAVQAVAMLSQPMFDALEVQQLQMPGCILPCAKSAADPPEGSLGLRKLALNMTDLSLILGASGSLAQELAVVVETVVQAVLQGYLPSLVTAVNGMGPYFLSNLNNQLWMHLDAAAYPCNQTDGLEGVVSASALKGLWGTSIGLLLVGLALAAAAPAVVAATAQRQRSGGHTGARSESGDGGAPRLQDFDPEDGSSTASHATDNVIANDFDGKECLAKSGVPLTVAVLYPFAVVSVMFLFLFADLDLGTSVDVLITAGGQSKTFGPLFSFSLISTIRSTWEAGAYAISILTLLFSGVWPIAKLAFLLVAWLVPPRRISRKMRGMMLSFLDVCGKYSLLDSWFLVLCMSAFSMEWQGGDASMKVLTHPTAAYFMFLLATIMSLLLGNVASYYHGRTEAKVVTKGQASNSRDASALDERRVALGRDGRGSASYLAVAASLLLGLTVTVAGVLMTSFQFSMSGLGAKLIFQEEHHIDKYSTLGVGAGVTASAPGSIGLMALQAVFLVISFAVPVLLMAVLLLLWVVPLRAEQQDSLLYVCHVLDSWSTLDVFVITVLVGHAEFSQLATRLLAAGSLKTVCGMVDEQLGLQCMELDLQLLPGSVLLLTAGLVALAVPKGVQWLCRSTARAREAKLKVPEGGHA